MVLNSVIFINSLSQYCYNTAVEPVIIHKLLDLHQQFYQTFAVQFAETRHRLQPGVQKILERLMQVDSILDRGCGNGELRRALVRHGYQGRYIGLDFSAGLLEEARREQLEADFRQADLSSDSWDANLEEGSFATVLALAVFHHIPSQDLRRQILIKTHRLLEPGGSLVLSNWQFLNSPRMKERILPWERAGLSEAQVEEGDYLLDWRQGGLGLRYVHHFSAEELAQLAEETGFEVQESFLSDGENGRLSIYQVWNP